MKKKLIITVGLLLVLTVTGFSGCARKKEAEVKQTAEVVRGDLVVTVNADGNLDMPHESKLKFGAPGTVKGIYVNEGDRVREGTLLAKLDDTLQKLAVAQAQYNVELAMNELVEKIHPAFMGYPKTYPDPAALQRLEQAREELSKAKKLLEQKKYQDAVSELRLAQHDLETCYYLVDLPEIKTLNASQDDLLGLPEEIYPDIPRAVEMLKQDLDRVVRVQNVMKEGNYGQATAELSLALTKLEDTYTVVKSVSGRIRMSQRIGACCGQTLTPTGLMPIPYPDTSTSLDFLKQVEEGLQKIQTCKKEGTCDAQELATLLRLAQHDVDMSRTILEENELTFRSGMNLKASRGYSLNLQLADVALKNAKDSLMKTEILAPFDGIVVYVGVKEDDQLSSFDYSSKVAVHLVDTKTVEMKGTVDEVDIYKVNNALGAGRKATVTSLDEALAVARTLKYPLLVRSKDALTSGSTDLVYTETQLSEYLLKCACYPVALEEAVEVKIAVDALPDKKLKGAVTFVSPFGTQQTGILNFAVTIQIEKTDVDLKGGLTATGDIIVDKHENVLVIPNRAVKGSPGDQWVEVMVDEAKKVTEKRVVKLGLQNETLSEVIDGLKQGEKVVIGGSASTSK